MSRVALVLMLAISNAHAQGAYTEFMFRKGIENLSTAPHYVLVSIRDEATGEQRLLCTEGAGLVFAILIEHRLEPNRQGMLQAIAIAAAQPDRVFSFANPDARIEAFYGETELSPVRERLSLRSDAELRAQLRGGRYPFSSPMERLLIAHVLLERGILVGRQDYAGGLYLAE